MGDHDRKKLIFFSAKDPEQDEHPTWSAYHFALAAHRAGLEAEVRLAGDAVRALKHGDDTGRIAVSPRLRTYMAEAVEAGLFVSG